MQSQIQQSRISCKVNGQCTKKIVPMKSGITASISRSHAEWPLTCLTCCSCSFIARLLFRTETQKSEKKIVREQILLEVKGNMRKLWTRFFLVLACLIFVAEATKNSVNVSIVRKMYIWCGKKLVCQNRAEKITLSVEKIEDKDFAMETKVKIKYDVHFHQPMCLQTGNSFLKLASKILAKHFSMRIFYLQGIFSKYRGWNKFSFVYFCICQNIACSILAICVFAKKNCQANIFCRRLQHYGSTVGLSQLRSHLSSNVIALHHHHLSQ